MHSFCHIEDVCCEIEIWCIRRVNESEFGGRQWFVSEEHLLAVVVYDASRVT